MIVTTEAIVLRARKHGETSKIVTLYTRDFGKLSVIAKGAREMKSKFGGALEAFARTNAVFYKKEKEGAEDRLYLLSKADLLRSSNKILQSLDRIEAASAAVELVLRSMHDEEENQEVFDLLSGALDDLAAAQEDAASQAILFRFYLQFARVAGFALQLESDEARIPPSDRRFEHRTIFQIQTGEMKDYAVDISDPHHQPLFRGIQLLPESRAALLFLDAATREKAASLRLSDRARTQLADLFGAYFAEHLPGVSSRTMKSGRVFSSLGNKPRP